MAKLTCGFILYGFISCKPYLILVNRVGADWLDILATLLWRGYLFSEYVGVDSVIVHVLLHRWYVPSESYANQLFVKLQVMLVLQPSPNRAGLSKDEELQLSWQVLFTVTKNPGTTNIIPYKIQVYQWQYMYNNTFHNKNHLTSSSYCVQMPWHQLSQQLGRRHLLTNHHISFKFLYMTKHQGTGRLAWNRHFKANLPWEKLERNHKSITHNLSVKSLHCPKHWLVAGLATSHCLTQWMDTELTTLRIPNLPMQA